MKKTDYKLFFYIDDNPININLKNYNYNSQQTNEIKSKLFHQDNQKNMYNKVKQKYDFYLKRNKNILLLNKKSTSGKITSKDYLENIENYDKEIKKDGLSLLPFVPNKKENNKNIEELKKLQRNTVTMRRIEYSMKVKNVSNKKKYKNNIKKIIIIQKWVRGFLLRNFLSNLSDFEGFKNEFLDHFKKFVFLKYKKDMYNIIKYFENKIIIEDEKNNNNKNNIIDNNIDNNKNEENNSNKGNKEDNNKYNYNKNEAMSFGDNLNNINKKSLDVIKENSNERYIDEDSIMEYNNRNKNNNNILFLSSKDFSDKNLINSNNNFINNSSNSNLLLNSNNNINTNNLNINSTPFILNESSIMLEETNKKKEGNNNNSTKKNNIKNDTLNSNKDDIFSTLKNEEARDVFNAKHSNNLVKPSPSIINNIINNENDLNNNKEIIIKRPRLNRKFIEEISSAHSSTPIKKETEVTKIDESANIFKKIESNFMNNSDEEKNNDILIAKKENEEKKNNENENDVKINNFIKKEIGKELNIYENEKNNKLTRKINYINSMKSNQFGSISNPTNTTKENSTLDSNTLNINRKLVLDENISINNNNKTVLEQNVNIIKPINKPMIITKIRLCPNKNIEYLIIKYSKSEKKSLPKIFDINYQYSKETTDNNNNNDTNNIIKEDIKDNINIDNNNDIININNSNNNNNDINKSISNDININVLNVVNNNVDELNSSIKNIVKEGLPVVENNQNKLNPFTKSIRALLDLDKPINDNIQTNKISENENDNNDKINEEINIDNNNNDNNDNNNNLESKENPMDVLNQMSIEEIKEVKEEYEEEKESELNFTQKRLYTSNEIIESSKEIDNILDSNKNLIRKSLSKNIKNNEFIICSQNISYSIIPNIIKKKNIFDKSQIFFMILLGKQIKFNVKPYIFNLLKKFWIEKLKNEK